MAYIQERISKTGKKSYRVVIRMRGYPTVSATFRKKTDATNWESETETAMRHGRYFKSSESRKRTVADLINRYLERVKKDSQERYDNLHFMLFWWKQEIGHCILSNLTKATISEKIDLLAATTWKLKNGTIKNISPARVNRYIAAFSHACTIAVTAMVTSLVTSKGCIKIPTQETR